MKEFEAIGERLKYEDNGFTCRRAEEIIKIQFVGTEIVRCKDCKWWQAQGWYSGWCKQYQGSVTKSEEFCARGKRRDDERV